MAPRRNVVSAFVFALIAVALGLLVLEGVSAVGLRLADRHNALRHPVAERKHTRYDPELGWVSVPSVDLPDLYGPGRSLHTNAQGFRGRRDTPREVPPGRIRLLCSGDSFTLGWGVDDADTWCAQLERLDDRIEAVNLGQGGYGVDQAYLWARRETGKLDHQLHVFAFISEDIQRMRYDSFRGYGKPTLTLEGGIPVAAGTPVPEPTDVAHPVERLHLVRAMRRLLGREMPTARPVMPLSDAAGLAQRALETLDRDARSRGSRFVAVWLPTLVDYISSDDDVLRRTLSGHLHASDVLVVDLVEDLRALPAERADSLFLKPDEVAYPAAGRHYSARGNAFIAAALWRRLQLLPAFAAASPTGPGHP